MAGPLLQVQEALAAWHAGLKTWAADVDVTLPKALQDGLPEEAGAPRHTTVLFGEHAGEPLWTRWRDIPGTAARDILQQMVATQADCHMASVEMQRELQDSAPSPEDKAALANVLEDNLTHAAALGGLLIRHFPKRGSIAAAQLLERRAFLHQRVLNAFNQPMRHWLDLYCFVGFVSLCARFSLETMAVGGFAPVAATADWLARRHAEHSRMGLWGLQRVVEAGAVGSPLLQRYINRWVALGLDLFGWEQSETAALAWRAGLKGRVHELERAAPPEDATRLNDDARARWLYEVERMLATLNRLHDNTPLRVPPWTANRVIIQDRPPTAHGAAVAQGAEGDPQWPLPLAQHDAAVVELSQKNGWILPA
jgi:1,2-phenylacetyl-CoA epoxidase catalytic subunit